MLPEIKIGRQVDSVPEVRQRRTTDERNVNHISLIAKQNRRYEGWKVRIEGMSRACRSRTYNKVPKK